MPNHDHVFPALLRAAPPPSACGTRGRCLAATFPSALLTIEDVAAQLAASDRHVRRLIERGELPVHRIGRLVRVSPDDLARLIAASRES